MITNHFTTEWQVSLSKLFTDIAQTGRVKRYFNVSADTF